MSKTFTNKPSTVRQDRVNAGVKQSTNKTSYKPNSTLRNSGVISSQTPSAATNAKSTEEKTPARRNQTMSFTRNQNAPNTGTSRFHGNGLEANSMQSPLNQRNHGQDHQGNLEHRMQYQGGFTSISPNEKKRQEISHQAKREEEQYKAYKDKNKLRTVNYCGTVGGGEVSLESARNSRIETHRRAKFDRLQAKEQRKMTFRQQEQLEIEKKKASQRQKAEQNMNRETLTSAERERKFGEDRRRTNEAFFQRIEKQRNQNLTTQHVPSSVPVEVETQQTSSYQAPPYNQEQQTLPEATGGSVLSPEDKSISTLMEMFPRVDQDVIADTLLECDYDLNQAIECLILAGD